MQLTTKLISKYAMFSILLILFISFFSLCAGVHSLLALPTPASWTVDMVLIALSICAIVVEIGIFLLVKKGYISVGQLD